VLNALIKNGLSILAFNEFDYSPYNIFSNPTELEKGKFRIENHGNKIPIVYAILAQKN
jgi:hypothetical protein